MGAFAAAYLVVWGAVLVYVLRLGGRQRRLDEAVRRLQARLDEADSPNTPTTRAA
jgi:CcmD family protein